MKSFSKLDFPDLSVVQVARAGLMVNFAICTNCLEIIFLFIVCRIIGVGMSLI